MQNSKPIINLLILLANLAEMFVVSGSESPELCCHFNGDESLLHSHYFMMYALVKSKGPLFEVNALYPKMIKLSSLYLFMHKKELRQNYYLTVAA